MEVQHKMNYLLERNFLAIEIDKERTTNKNKQQSQQQQKFIEINKYRRKKAARTVLKIPVYQVQINFLLCVTFFILSQTNEAERKQKKENDFLKVK